MAIEIVDLPIKNGDFPVRYVSLPEGKHPFLARMWKLQHKNDISMNMDGCKDGSRVSSSQKKLLRFKT